MVARLLDVTRLVSRAGRMPTGVDRVELAYLEAMGRDYSGPRFAIARTALGYVLMDDRGMNALAHAVRGGPWGQVDWLSRINPRLNPAAARGQSFVRDQSIARSTRSGLPRMLDKHLPGGFEYYNVGHSNLNRRMLHAVKTRTDAQIHILIHDTIPLDWPDFQRPGTVTAFESKLRLSSSYADRVICTSLACLKDVQRHMSIMGRIPPMIPALLGIDPPTAGPIPKGVIPQGHYFVMVGTIEPRKNHKLMLDIWDRFAGNGPSLVIAGSRGWNNEEVFSRLDKGIPNVTEVADLSDGAIATLLRGSCGLLFPSFAEGFGLPPAEAASLGTPVVCADLAACGEIMGKTPVYLDPSDGYQWENTILRLANDTTPQSGTKFVPPDWDSHFKLVFSEA